MSTARLYTIIVVGGNNELDSSIVGKRADGVLSPLLKGQSTSLRLQHVDGSGILNITDLSTTDDRKPTICALKGPSGKGEYQLQAIASAPTDRFMLGSNTLSKDWMLVGDYDRILLRHKHDSLTSRWIAVPELDDSGQRLWSFWWYSPSAANMDDFEAYLAIDLELVEVKLDDQ